jgi:chromosome partitioning protein
MIHSEAGPRIRIRLTPRALRVRIEIIRIERDMTIIAVFNQKGGVGKTTTSLNLTAAIGRRGKDPLAIDLDPQAHLSAISRATVNHGEDSIFAFYKGTKPLAKLVQTTASGTHIIPSHFELSKVDSLFGKGPTVINRLKHGLQEEMLVHENMPVIIDCCPMLGVLSLNAIFASEKVLVPVSTDYLAFKGAQQLERTLKALEHVLKKRVARRYLVTRFDSRRKMSWDIIDQMREQFGDDLCETRIGENVSLSESPAYDRDVFAHAPNSQGAKDYDFLLDELIETGFL